LKLTSNIEMRIMCGVAASSLQERNYPMKPTPLILVDEPLSVPSADQSNDNPWAEVRRLKVRVGRPVPQVRLNAILRGEYTVMDPDAISDRWLALCCLPLLQAADVSCLNRQAGSFARVGAMLLALLPDEILLDSAHHREFKQLTIPLVTDPLKRLHRAYGVAQYPLSLKARTFLIDPERILRHYVVHDLNMWSMDSLRGLMNLKREAANLNNTRYLKEGARNVIRAS
jgi:alkyl hydroperoxide reductase subunit AhpC